METTSSIAPTTLGLKPSFGFGDRLGLATPGHILACRRGRFVPVFAQQSAREFARTRRTPEEVLASAQQALAAEGWTGAWGADADHLKTREDVERFAAAGFTFFTIDPSAYVHNAADRLNRMALQLAVGDLIKSGAFESQQEIDSLYWNRRFDLPGDLVLAFTDRDILHRAAVKYGRAIAYAQQMAGWIAEAMGSRSYEIEISVDETETPTSALDHLFFASELRRRNLRPISLAPRFLGDFEPGVEYRGEIDKFEASLRQHVAIARRFGPYKLSVHSGSDKFRIYPILGRVCRSLLHVKTIGTSYLEGLRVVARVAPELFLGIVECARTRYETDRTFYKVSARLADARAPAGLNPKEREQEYLDQPAGRQILHVTAGSVLSAGMTLQGCSFRQALIEVVESQPALYRDFLARHLGRHIELLSSG